MRQQKCCNSACFSNKVMVTAVFSLIPSVFKFVICVLLYFVYCSSLFICSLFYCTLYEKKNSICLFLRAYFLYSAPEMKITWKNQSTQKHFKNHNTYLHFILISVNYFCFTFFSWFFHHVHQTLFSMWQYWISSSNQQCTYTFSSFSLGYVFVSVSIGFLESIYVFWIVVSFLFFAFLFLDFFIYLSNAICLKFVVLFKYSCDLKTVFA